MDWCPAKTRPTNERALASLFSSDMEKKKKRKIEAESRLQPTIAPEAIARLGTWTPPHGDINLVRLVAESQLLPVPAYGAAARRGC